MSYAHKLETYQDDAYKPVIYCTVCGQEKDLGGECPGEYIFTPSEKASIDKRFSDDMKKIFT